MTPSTPPAETGALEPLGGFRWCRADTFAVIGMAVVLILAYYPMAFQGKIPLDRDTLTYFYPLLSCFEQPRLGLWNPFQLGGCSLIANPQAALFYPPNWIFLVLPTDIGLILSTLGHYYLAAVGMYLLARFSRLSISAALVAALVFCLGGYMTSRLVLRPLLLSAAWFPWVFLCYLYAHYRRVYLGYLLAGGFLALQILTGMPHNAVYSAIALGFFLVYKILREAPYERRYRVWGRRAAGYVLFLAVGLLLSAIMLLPTLELLPHTVRTWFHFEEATSGSLAWQWLPDIFTGGSYHQARVDWEFNETNCYIGALALWLVLFALMGQWQKGIFWFYIGLIGLSLLFALGDNTPFFALFYKFPYLESLGVPTLGRFFDIPSRFLGLTAFALAMLAGYGMEVLGTAGRTGKDRLNRTTQTILALLGAGCLIWGVVLVDLAIRLGPRLLPLVAQPAAKSDTAQYYVYANFGFFTLAFGLFTIAFLLGYLRKRAFQALMIFALAADLLHSGSQVGLSFGRAENALRPPVPVRFLQERADPSLRVMGFDALKTTGGDIKYTRLAEVFTPKLGLLYRVPDVSGYDPLILRRYSRLVQDTVGLAPGETPLRVVAWRSPQTPLLDLLRVGYVSGEVHERLILGSKVQLQPEERRVLQLEADRPVREIRIRSALTGGIMIQQNTQVGQVVLRDASGEEVLFPIRAGRETADVAAERAHFHHPAPAFQSWSFVIGGQKTRVHNYVCRLPLPRPMRPVELELRNDSQVLWGILAVGLTEEPSGRFEAVTVPGFSGEDRIYRNTTALPRAWWVHRVHVEPSAKRLVDLVAAGRLPDGSAIDYRSLALLEKTPAHAPAPSEEPEGGRVEVLEWQPGRIVLEAESDAPGVLVLSEIKYPGWKATVDGKQAEIMAVNYILRGLSLPAGSHRVEMVYRPRSFSFGLGASALTALLVILLFLRYRRLFPARDYSRTGAGASQEP